MIKVGQINHLEVVKKQILAYFSMQVISEQAYYLIALFQKEQK